MPSTISKREECKMPELDQDAISKILGSKMKPVKEIEFGNFPLLETTAEILSAREDDLTPEEADAAYDAAPADEISDDEIQSLVEFVTASEENEQELQTSDTDKTDFREGLEKLINMNSLENGSGTPDFILAEYLTDCLSCFDKAVRQREAWYGRETNFLIMQ